MSKLIDRLNQVAHAVSSPMGFHRAPAVVSRPRMLLIAGLPQDGADSLTNRVRGADAALLRVSDTAAIAGVLASSARSVTDIPWGVRLGDGQTEGAGQAIDSGCDFLVFSLAAPLNLRQEKNVARLLEVELSANIADGLLRSANALPLDGVLVVQGEEKNGTFTWGDLLILRRFADLLTKPLFTVVPVNISAVELQAIWEAGVVGILVSVRPEQAEDALANLAQTLARLEVPQRKMRQAKAVGPHIHLEVEAPVETEEEGDDEEEEEDI